MPYIRLQLVSSNIKYLLLVLLIAAFIVPLVGLNHKASAVACTLPTTDYGMVASSASVSTTATYRVWTRMFVPDTTNNNYRLEIDGNTCFSVGGSGVAPGVWVWVAFQNGNSTSRTDLALSQGTHSFKLIGNRPGVKIDKLVFTSDMNCVPIGYGDNCNAPDDRVAPTTKLTSPSAGSTVSGSNTVLAATATDAAGVTKVEFFINGILIASDSSAPYNTNWDSTKTLNGSNQLSLRAYDTSGNVGTYSHPVTVANGDTQAPTVPTKINVEAVGSNKVDIKWSPSSDNIGVTGYKIYRDGLPLATVTAGVSYADTFVNPGTSYAYKIDAFDAAGNRSALSPAVTVITPKSTVSDTKAPTQPLDVAATAVGSSQINITWSPSTDNISAVSYDVYRTNLGRAAQKIGDTSSVSFGDTGLSKNTAYTYHVIARDAAGNLSSPSAAVGATTFDLTVAYDISGVVRSEKKSSRLSGVHVTYILGGATNIYQTNKSGLYRIPNLLNGTYSLKFEKIKYTTSAHVVTILDNDVGLNTRLSK